MTLVTAAHLFTTGLRLTRANLTQYSEGKYGGSVEPGEAASAVDDE